MKPHTIIACLGAVLGLTSPASAIAGGPQPIAAEEWITIADNHPDASQLELDGTVSVELGVSAAGRVTSCDVLKSTGHAFLDQHTCRLLLSRAQFKPATDDSGSPVPGTFRHTIRWQVITNANWAQNGFVRAEATIDPASEHATECDAKISGQMSDHMEQMACFILINQVENIMTALGSRPQRPFRAALVFAVYPKASAVHAASAGDQWLRVAYTDAAVFVSLKGQRTDCSMIETQGPPTLIFPVCTQMSAFRYVPVNAPTDSPSATELRQEVAYYAENPT